MLLLFILLSVTVIKGSSHLITVKVVLCFPIALGPKTFTLRVFGEVTIELDVTSVKDILAFGTTNYDCFLPLSSACVVLVYDEYAEACWDDSGCVSSLSFMGSDSIS